MVCGLRGLPGEVTFELRPEEYEGLARERFGNREFQAEGAASAKVLRQDGGLCAGGTRPESQTLWARSREVHAGPPGLGEKLRLYSQKPLQQGGDSNSYH